VSPWPPLRSRTETAGGRVEKLFETQVLHVMAITPQTLKRLAVVSSCGTAVFAASFIIYECYGILKSLRSIRTAHQQSQMDRINQLEAEFTQATNALADRQAVVTEQAARIRAANETLGTLRAQLVVVTNDRDVLQAGETRLAERVQSFEARCVERQADLRAKRDDLERQSDALDELTANMRAEQARALEVRQTIKVLEARVAAAEAEAASARKAYATAKAGPAVAVNGKRGDHPPGGSSDTGSQVAVAVPVTQKSAAVSRPSGSTSKPRPHNAGGLGPLIVPTPSAVVQQKANAKLGELLAAGSKPKPRIAIGEADFQGWGRWTDDFGAVATLLWKKRQFKAHAVNGRVEPRKQAEILAWFKAANSLRRSPPGYDTWELTEEEHEIARKGIAGIRYRLKQGKGKDSRQAATIAFSAKHPLEREIAVATLSAAREARGQRVDKERLAKSSVPELVSLAQTSRVSFNDTITVSSFAGHDEDERIQASLPLFDWDHESSPSRFDGPVVDLSRRNLKSQVSSKLDIVVDDDLSDEDLMPLIVFNDDASMPRVPYEVLMR
jgi:hypothetical protein